MKKISIFALLSLVSIGYMVYSMERPQTYLGQVKEMVFGEAESPAEKALEEFKQTGREADFVYAVNTVAQQKPVNAYIAAEIVILGQVKHPRFYAPKALNEGFWQNFGQGEAILAAIKAAREAAVDEMVANAALLTDQLNKLDHAQAILNGQPFKTRSHGDVLKEVSDILEGK